MFIHQQRVFCQDPDRTFITTKDRHCPPSAFQLQRFKPTTQKNAPNGLGNLGRTVSVKTFLGSYNRFIENAVKKVAVLYFAIPRECCPFNKIISLYLECCAILSHNITYCESVFRKSLIENVEVF